MSTDRSLGLQRHVGSLKAKTWRTHGVGLMDGMASGISALRSGPRAHELRAVRASGGLGTLGTSHSREISEAMGADPKLAHEVALTSLPHRLATIRLAFW